MYHKIEIIGYLGRSPQLRKTSQGTDVANLSVASNHTYTNRDGETVKETTWFRVSVFGKNAVNVATYCKKGCRVFIEGRLTPDENGGPRIWTRNDGSPAASFEVIAHKVLFLGGSNDDNTPATDPRADLDDLPAADDEIPF